jgi:hypothetical protein
MDAAHDKWADKWAKIKAAYQSEGEYAAIATARELGVRTLEVIPKIREWKAAEAAAAAATKESAKPPDSELIITGLSPGLSPGRSEGTVDVVERNQKRLSAQLRGVLEHELEETQAMSSMASSFVDVDHIERLKMKAFSGDTKPLAEFLLNAARARKVVVEHVEKLARAINQAIQCERSVWGLDDANKGKGADEAVNWQAILDDLRKPIAAPTLPDNVIEFERKLRLLEGGRRGS